VTQGRGEQIKIAIVDDHKVIREGLRMLLGAQPGYEIVGTADDSSGALSLIKEKEPDVVLLDLDLNGEISLGLIPQVNDLFPHTRVLILTGAKDLEMHQECVRLGASGLVQKDVTAEVLVKAIKTVNAGEIWFANPTIMKFLSEVRNKRSEQEKDPEATKIATLTKREKEIIGLVCEGLKNKEVAERLYISDTTVRHHLTSIFSKLEVPDRLGLVIYSYRFGLAAPPK
jgi:two-component system nitrate/nitrite response regulator NarL